MRENNTVSSPVQFQQDASTISNVLHAALNETPNNSSRREDLNLRIEDLHQHTSSATILDVKAMLAQHDQELKEKNSREQTEQDTRRRELAGSENEFIIRPLDSWHMTATEGNKLYATSKRSQDESPMDAMLEKEIQEILNKKQGRVLADGTVKTAEEYLSLEDQKRLQNIRESLARTAATTGDPELFNKTLTPQKNGFFRNVLIKGGSARAEDGKTLRRDIPVVPDDVVVKQELRIENVVGKRAKRITGGPELDSLKAKNDAINSARNESEPWEEVKQQVKDDQVAKDAEARQRRLEQFEKRLKEGRAQMETDPEYKLSLERENIGVQLNEIKQLLDNYSNKLSEGNEQDAKAMAKEILDKQDEIIALWVEHENKRNLEFYINHSKLPKEVKIGITEASERIIQEGKYNHESLLKLSQLLLENIEDQGIEAYLGNLKKFAIDVGLGGILERTLGATKEECEVKGDFYYSDQKNIPNDAKVIQVKDIGFLPSELSKNERGIKGKRMKVVFDHPEETGPVIESPESQDELHYPHEKREVQPSLDNEANIDGEKVLVTERISNQTKYLDQLKSRYTVSNLEENIRLARTGTDNEKEYGSAKREAMRIQSFLYSLNEVPKDYVQELEEINSNLPAMNNQTKLSILIPAYNEEGRIERTLESWTTQQLKKGGEKLDPQDLEIIVLINKPNHTRSFDNTEEVIEQFKQKHPEFAASLHVVKKEFNFETKKKMVNGQEQEYSDVKMGTIYRYLTDLAVLRNIQRLDNGADPNIAANHIMRTGGADVFKRSPYHVSQILESFGETAIEQYVSLSDYPPEVYHKLPLLYVTKQLQEKMNEYLTSGLSHIGLGTYRTSLYAEAGGFEQNMRVAEEVELSKRMRRKLLSRGKTLDDVRKRDRVLNAIDDPKRDIAAIYSGKSVTRAYEDYQINETIRDMDIRTILQESIPAEAELSADNFSKQAEGIFKLYLNLFYDPENGMGEPKSTETTLVHFIDTLKDLGFQRDHIDISFDEKPFMQSDFYKLISSSTLPIDSIREKFKVTIKNVPSNEEIDKRIDQSYHTRQGSWVFKDDSDNTSNTSDNSPDGPPNNPPQGPDNLPPLPLPSRDEIHEESNDDSLFEALFGDDPGELSTETLFNYLDSTKSKIQTLLAGNNSQASNFGELNKAYIEIKKRLTELILVENQELVQEVAQEFHDDPDLFVQLLLKRFQEDNRLPEILHTIFQLEREMRFGRGNKDGLRKFNELLRKNVKKIDGGTVYSPDDLRRRTKKYLDDYKIPYTIVGKGEYADNAEVVEVLNTGLKPDDMSDVNLTLPIPSKVILGPTSGIPISNN